MENQDNGATPSAEDILAKQYSRLATLSEDAPAAQDMLLATKAFTELQQSDIFTQLQIAINAANDARTAESNINQAVLDAAAALIAANSEEFIRGIVDGVTEDAAQLTEDAGLIREQNTLIAAQVQTQHDNVVAIHQDVVNRSEAAVNAANDIDAALLSAASDLLENNANTLVEDTVNTITANITASQTAVTEALGQVQALEQSVTTRANQVDTAAGEALGAATQVETNATAVAQAQSAIIADRNAVAQLRNETQGFAELVEESAANFNSLFETGDIPQTTRITIAQTGVIPPWRIWLADARTESRERALPTTDVPDNAEITVRDRYGAAGRNEIRITGPIGQVTEGEALRLTTNRAWVTLKYNLATTTWIIIAGDA